MTENKHNPENKPIRFIDSSYRELFAIPDGGYITVTHDGEQMVRKCKYHGETHVEIGTNLYHICEFAERMERGGGVCEPCPEPEAVHGYVITDRAFVGDKVFVLAHNPDAVQPYVTWKGRNDRHGYDLGHYWTKRSDARSDYFLRADAERTGKTYDHTKLYRRRDDAR
jgi:hypothetical protein